MIVRQLLLRLVLLASLALVSAAAIAADRFITVASTTSTENSGLYDYLLPIFRQASGIEVRVVAVGTGKAIKLAERGDADVLLVHHKPSELRFVEMGYGIKRYDLMYNEFVLVGPRQDPAAIRGMDNVTLALARIAEARSVFVSRGDESGTHHAELELWGWAGTTPGQDDHDWYLETGSGMGATLNVASAKNGYVLTDRATWLKFENKRNLEILSEGDSRLLNQYGVTRVSEQRFPHIKADDARQFVQWLVSEAGQNAINNYLIRDQQGFVANAEVSD